MLKTSSYNAMKHRKPPPLWCHKGHNKSDHNPSHVFATPCFCVVVFFKTKTPVFSWQAANRRLNMVFCSISCWCLLLTQLVSVQVVNSMTVAECIIGDNLWKFLICLFKGPKKKAKKCFNNFQESVCDLEEPEIQTSRNVNNTCWD